MVVVFFFQFSSVLSRILDGACVSYKAVDGDVFAHWSEDVQGHNAAFGLVEGYWRVEGTAGHHLGALASRWESGTLTVFTEVLPKD